jgi:hypothetical protein
VGGIEVREETRIRSNGYLTGSLLVEHLHGKRRGKATLPFPFLSSMRSYF